MLLRQDQNSLRAWPAQPRGVREKADGREPLEGGLVPVNEIGADSSSSELSYFTNFLPSNLHRTWIGVNHYSASGYGNDWNAIVLHISVCRTLQQIDNTFLGTRQVSAHFGVGDGQIHWYIVLNHAAWAVGHWEWNMHTVSIEHVGMNSASTSTMDMSVQLMTAPARQKGWKQFVVGGNVGIHRWYCATAYPGDLNVRYIVSKANEYLGNGFTYYEVPSGWARPTSQHAPRRALRLLWRRLCH